MLSCHFFASACLLTNQGWILISLFPWFASTAPEMAAVALNYHARSSDFEPILALVSGFRATIWPASLLRQESPASCWKPTGSKRTRCLSSLLNRTEQKHRIHTGLCENCLRFLYELRGSVFAITHKCNLPTNWRKWFEIRKELLIKCIWLSKLSTINVLVALWSPSLPFTCGSTFNFEQNTKSLQDLEYRLAALHFPYHGGKSRFNQRWVNQKFFFLQLLCFCISGSRAERREVPVLLLVAFLAVMFLLAIAALLCFCGIRAQHRRNSKPGIIHHPGPGLRPLRGSSTNELWTSPTEREQHEHWNNQAFMNDISSRTCQAMHYGIRADILKKAIRKCLTLKIDFSANFNLTHDFFGRRLSQHPKNWKTQKWIYKYQFKGV